MPDNEELIDDSPATAGGGGKKKLITIAIVAGLMLVEGGVIYWAVNVLGGDPAESAARQARAEQGVLGLETKVEIELPETNAFNKKEGRLYLFSMQVTILVHTDDADKVRKALEARGSTIQDRFNTVIRSAELSYLNEPGLDTIRRQFRFELDKILGDDQLILELLINKFFQSPADV